MKNRILKEKVEKLSKLDPKDVTINREKKRRLLKISGIKPSEADKYFKKSAKLILDILPEDTKVKLNYDRIINSPIEKSESYLKFIEEHKDIELTAYQDKKHEGTTLYCLREDDTDEESKWLFDISDLIYDEDSILDDLLEEDGFKIDENNNLVIAHDINNEETNKIPEE